jgi:hypothetical protein
VTVPLAADAGFFTLVTTCTDGADYSWSFFGDPVLELEVADL